MESTLDYTKLTGMEFEQLVTNLLIKLGYRDVKNRRGTADGGIDVEAVSVTPISINTIAIQCKRYADNKVRLHHIRNLDSAVKNEDFTSGVIITSGEFTKDAIEYANMSSVKITLINGMRLSELIITAFPDTSLEEIVNITDFEHLPIVQHVDTSEEQRMIKEPDTGNQDKPQDIEPSPSYDSMKLLPETNDKTKQSVNSLLGGVIVQNGKKIRLNTIRQIDRLDSKIINIACPSCGLQLRQGNYCLLEDWIFTSLSDLSETKTEKYCTHHPASKLIGERKYCQECQWHYA